MAEALNPAMADNRRSSRKRKVIDYAAEDSPSGDKIVKPAKLPLPPRQRKKVVRESLAVPQNLAHTETSLSAGLTTMPSKDKLLDMGPSNQLEHEVTTKGKPKKKGTGKGEEKRMKR